jgi:hypothetical protein
MNASNFDRFTRAFAQPASRRGLLAFAGGVLALRRQQTDAAQLSPDSCASTGEVCTLLYGCCSGLSCATSAINPSYGVCIPGDGGTVSTGTSLVVPFDEGDGTAAQPAVDDTSTTTTTDPQAEREQRIAEKKARRDAHRNKVELRKDEQKDQRDEQQEKRKGPRLSIDLLFPEGTTEEHLSIRNLSDDSVLLTKITTLSDSGDGSFLDEVLSSDETHVLISGIPLETDVESNEFVWRNLEVCNGQSDGFVLSASFSSEGLTKTFTIDCASGEVDEDVSARRRKNKNGNNNNGKNRKRQRNKGRGNKNHKNG